jgi:hypothetical protein
MANKKVIKIISAVIIMFLVSFNSNAQQQYTYNFLTLNTDARSSAMAGSVVSMEDDVNLIFYNPAALSTLKNMQASVGFFKYLMDINSGSAAYSQYFKDIGYLGAGIRYVNYGNFDRYDENYQNTGTFGASDFSLSIGYANIVKQNLKLGANAKFIYSTIDEYNSIGLAVDLGAIYTFPEDKFNIGASILNLGAQLKSYNGNNERLPLDVRLGITKQLEYLPLTFNLGWSNLADDYDNFFDRFKNIIVGGEFNLNEYVDLRIGYSNPKRQNYRTGSSIGLGGFSAGLGIKLQEKYKLDYAFNSLGDVGAEHRINLGFILK